jgi:N-acetylneuraminic acid mutarotase
MLRLTTVTLFLCNALNAQTWVDCAPVPAAGRDDGAAFSIGSYCYIVTGNQGGFSESNRLWRYDPSSGLWSEKSAFPGTPRQYAGCFAIEGSAYIVGGISESSVPLKVCWKYDPATDEWTQLGDFPGEARWSMFTAELNGSGYLGTGTTLTGFLSDFWRFDPHTGEWMQLNDFAGGPRRETAAFAAGENIYAGTGYADGYIPVSSFYSYSLLTGSWSQEADLPGPARSYATAVSSGFYGYAGTGYGPGNAFLTDMYRFDLSSGSWEEISGFTAGGIRGMSAFALDREPYFLTGLSVSEGRTSAMWRLADEQIPEVPFFVYPNPSGGTTVIEATPGSQLSIFGADGKMVGVRDITSPVSTLTPGQGTYLLRLRTGTGERTLRLIVL